MSGSIRVERGEQLVFPTATEAPLDADGVVDAINLKAWEYVAVQEMSSGKVREGIGGGLPDLGVCGCTGNEQWEGEGGHGGPAWPGEWGVGSAASTGGSNDMDWRGVGEGGHAVSQRLYEPTITMCTGTVPLSTSLTTTQYIRKPDAHNFWKPN